MEEKAPPEFIKIMKTLEDALKDKEKREKVDRLLETFAKLERKQFLARLSSFARYIDEICGPLTSNALLGILSQGIPDVNEPLEQIENVEVQNWLRQLNSKYISSYEGVFPPIPHDWYRVSWGVKTDVSHGNIPLIEATILKRNGEIVYFEMPLPAMVKLTNYLLERIPEAKEVGVLKIPGMREELENTKKIVETILKS